MGNLRAGSPTVLGPRHVDAVDGAQVNGSAEPIHTGRDLYAEYDAVVTLGGGTIEVRAALEGSVDGTNWHQLVRFKDATATSHQVARFSGSAAAGSLADLAGAALGSASAGGSILDGPIPFLLRFVTKCQARTGAAVADLTCRIVAR